MRKVSATDVLGFEYDWLARDADGYVALFCTAGGGYAPPGLLDDPDAHHAACEAALAMPQTTSGTLADEDHQRVWLGMVERGAYVFDADSFGGDYRRIGAPNHPLNIDAFPAAVREVAIVIADLRFASAPSVASELLKQRTGRPSK